MAIFCLLGCSLTLVASGVCVTGECLLMCCLLSDEKKVLISRVNNRFCLQFRFMFVVKVLKLIFT